MTSAVVYPNRIGRVERELAALLARVCHFMLPEVIPLVRAANHRFRHELSQAVPPGLVLDRWMFDGADTIFPGVRRHIGSDESRRKRHVYYPDAGAILDANFFPRYIWTFLAGGVAFSGPAWKSLGLSAFELGHLFPHKTDEVSAITGIWPAFPEDERVWALFTSASAVILIPKGCAKPTDVGGAVLACFFQRYLDLYGGPPVPGMAASVRVPGWYDTLRWSRPIQPPHWRARLDLLLAYRRKRIRHILTRPSNG